MRPAALRAALVFCVFAAAMLAGSVSARASSRDLASPSSGAPFTTDDPALQASLARLFSRSAAWREAVEQVRRTGRRAYLVTPDRVRMIDPRGGVPKPFARELLA